MKIPLLKLIDLSRVQITDEIIELIGSEITNNIHVPNYFEFMLKLGKFEINSLETDFMVSTITNMHTKGGVFVND